MKKIVIYGAGRYGSLAYHFYNQHCEILFFVDANKKKWGTNLNGIEICSPTRLREDRYHVVISVAQDADKISDELIHNYDLLGITKFSVSTESVNNGENEINVDNVCIMFSGGLGNQMFQYAVKKAIEINGRKTVADITLCEGPESPEFLLDRVFPNICVKKVRNAWGMMQDISRNRLQHNLGKRMMWYSEDLRPGIQKKADLSVLRITGGVLKGLFQTCYFADTCRSELLNDFTFDCRSHNDLMRIKNRIESQNYVGIHIRRGDYLSEINKEAYEGICNQEYYDSAIRYMTERVQDVKLCFFSNDIEYVKKEFSQGDALYVQKEMFDEYEDWYDMYLMSVCKHNIIANSTFSWWGAWLNRNPDKIVIAPSKWINTFDYKDIYPKNWVTL